MSRLVLRSPAKVNLFLKVINKRPDGYHNLVTLFERIDLFDELTFVSNASGKVRLFCQDPQVPRGPKNLVYQVAHKLQKDFKVRQGVDIRIKKRIPVAAGLAGGSSNAATALVGLNRLWKLSLSRDQLVVYGKQVGADVAFFLYETPWALGTERGDKIRRLAIRPRFWHVLAVPRVKMYTRKVFEHLNLRHTAAPTNMLTKQSDNVNILIRHLRKKDLKAVSSRLCNDLEISVFQLCPKLRKLKATIRKLGAIGVSLSGSGPSIFALTDSQKQAEFLKSILKKRYSRVFVVGTY